MTKIERYGDDLVIPLPSEVVEALRLDAAEIELHAADRGRIEVVRVPGSVQAASFQVWSDPGDGEAARSL